MWIRRSHSPIRVNPCDPWLKTHHIPACSPYFARSAHRLSCIRPFAFSRFLVSSFILPPSSFSFTFHLAVDPETTGINPAARCRVTFRPFLHTLRAAPPPVSCFRSFAFSRSLVSSFILPTSSLFTLGTSLPIVRDSTPNREGV